MNTEKLKELIGAYKAHFNENISNEIYKWKAVKCFQDNWDIEAKDFASMLSKSLKETSNLLASANNFPRSIIEQFASRFPEETRSAFALLFDEKEDLIVRIEGFKTQVLQLLELWSTAKRNHYQSYNVISTYLWLRYPDKYYVFKPTIAQKVFDELEIGDNLWGEGADAIIKCYEEYDAVAEYLQKDKEYRVLLNKALKDDCYRDEALRVAVVDFAFYVGKYRQIETKNIEKGVKIQEEIQKVDKNLKITYNSWDDAIIRVLGDSDKPLKAKDISRIVLDNKYYKTDGKTPERTISSYLTQNQKKYYNGVGNASYVLSDLGRQKYQELKNIIIDRKEDEVDVDVSNIEIESEKYYYNKTKFLEEVFMSDSDYEKLYNLLLRKKNIILQGAPGVGKTFAAKRLAYSLVGEKREDRVCCIQFHQNYTYEDFIMGYKPEDDKFVLRKGVFYDFCILAKKNPNEKYFFIIDEINRGNLSKIFGELLMLIENDHRGESLKLAYNGEEFYVPKNLYMIGMMNTADRSLAMIDYALRRRFSFFEMRPGFDSKGFKDCMSEINNTKFNSLIEQIVKLNRVIADDDSLGSGFEIGHSYFCCQKVEEVTNEWMKGIVDYDIIPTLQEYWFDDKQKLEEWSKKLRGVFENGNE